MVRDGGGGSLGRGEGPTQNNAIGEEGKRVWKVEAC